MTETLYIDNDNALTAFCEQIGDAEFIALDTEFMREKTFYPRLCLVQIEANGRIACVDPFSVTDFSPLLAIFRDQKIIKVLHSVSQDMEVFLHTFDCLPSPVYDTQIAASLTGLGEQVSYAKLVDNMLGTQLDKSHTRTDWTRRPLDEAQIRYAADDVRYLAELYPLQRQKLEAQGRLEWLKSDFDGIVEESRYRPDPDNAWRKVKGHARMRGADLAVLSVLAKYREEQAIRHDRPRRFILGDDLLLDLVKSKPRNLQDIERRRGFNAGLITKHGEALLECIKTGLSLPREQWPETDKGKPLTSNQEVLADILMGLLKQQAQKNDVSVASMASRKEVERLARGKRDIALTAGWRYELGGKVLTDFLDGQISLAVADRQLVVN